MSPNFFSQLIKNKFFGIFAQFNEANKYNQFRYKNIFAVTTIQHICIRQNYMVFIINLAQI